MSTDDRASNSPPVRAISAFVGFAFLFVAGGLVFYGLTPDEHKTDIWNALRVALPAAFAAIPAILAWLYSSKAASQLNGGFDDRVKRLVNEVLDERERTAR